MSMFGGSQNALGAAGGSLYAGTTVADSSQLANSAGVASKGVVNVYGNTVCGGDYLTSPFIYSNPGQPVTFTQGQQTAKTDTLWVNNGAWPSIERTPSVPLGEFYYKSADGILRRLGEIVPTELSTPVYERRDPREETQREMLI